MLIETTTYWPAEENELTGEKTKAKTGPIVIISDHIVAFDPIDEETMIRLSNGEVFQIQYPFQEFYDLMMSIQVSLDLLNTEQN